jgi:threonine/homoserine/homoserine lactone efflux protein
MDLQLWAGFALASLVLAIVPGPGVATILGFALSSGRRTALGAVAGMAFGNAIAISLSLAGAGAMLAASATAFLVLKWVGALYLIGMGVLAIRNAGRPGEAVPDVAPVSLRSAFLMTMAVGVFHPKTIIFFMAFATQFIQADAPFLPQAAVLVITFTAIAAMTDALYAMGGAKAAGRLKSATARLWTRRAGGGVLILAGAATATIRR